jgi:subtilase family serine protease
MKSFILRSLTCFVLVLIAPARAQQRLLTAHVPPAVANGQAQWVDRLPATTPLSLAISLPLPKEADLDLFLRGLYDPQSASYRQYLTVQQFTERFGPSQQDYDAVVHFAEANHLSVTNAAPNRLVVAVRGTAGDVEKAFHVTMGVYRHPTENRTFYSADREPSVDLSAPLLHISGLDNYSLPRPHHHPSSPDHATGHTTGSGPGGNFIGGDMRAAYYGGNALTGAGQTVGLFEFGGYEMSDVQAYFKTAGEPLNVPIIGVSVDGTSLSCNPSCDDSEQVLDIDEAIGMAPGLNAVIVYVGDTDPVIFNRMATDNIAEELSCSWGWDPDAASLDPIFKEFAAQGQTLFVASGDNGAYTSSNKKSGYVWPADDPNVTAVGGTDLTTSGPGGSWVSETSWVYSGGGVSPNGEKIPSYQTTVITAANGGSLTLRNAPDVAAEGNTDNYYAWNGKTGTGEGGTSYAAPRWAGFMALVNEQAAANGNPPVGFLNPTLYALGQSSSYADNFHDIISGNNDSAKQSAYYNAVPGYDLVTGWGSPTGLGLIDTLAGGSAFSPAAAPTFSPPAGTYSSAQNVAISSATSGASIRYTTNGSAPTETNGTLYSGPVNISSTATLMAIADKSGFTDSSVTSGLYTIGASPPPPPTFSEPAGAYTKEVHVRVTDSNSNASLYYTTDGSTPTASSPPVSNGTIKFKSTTTLEAVAVLSGVSSAVTSATYTIVK